MTIENLVKLLTSEGVNPKATVYHSTYNLLQELVLEEIDIVITTDSYTSLKVEVL